MVGQPAAADSGSELFQYSLCRVVLMVANQPSSLPNPIPLSVLALSSRFDGPKKLIPLLGKVNSFSTRSVESF